MLAQTYQVNFQHSGVIMSDVRYFNEHKEINIILHFELYLKHIF